MEGFKTVQKLKQEFKITFNPKEKNKKIHQILV